MTNERRPRRLTLVLALVLVGVVLDLIISAALGFAVTQARRNASQVNIVKVAAYEACITSNRRAASDLTRWDRVLELVESGPPQPGRAAFIAGVRIANKSADAPLPCGRLAP